MRLRPRGIVGGFLRHPSSGASLWMRWKCRVYIVSHSSAPESTRQICAARASKMCPNELLNITGYMQEVAVA